MADFNADLVAGGFLDEAASQLDFTHADINADLAAGGALDPAAFQLDFDHADFDADVIIVSGGGSTPPVVTNVSPADMSVITPTTPITFRVAETSVRLTVIWLLYATANETLLVYDGVGFQNPFLGASSATPGLNYVDYSILPVGGWLDDIASLRIRSIDTQGAIDIE